MLIKANSNIMRGIYDIMLGLPTLTRLADLCMLQSGKIRYTLLNFTFGSPSEGKKLTLANM